MRLGKHQLFMLFGVVLYEFGCKIFEKNRLLRSLLGILTSENLTTDPTSNLSGLI